MTVFKENNYYILDTKKRSIIILDDNFNKTKNLSKNNIKFDNF